MSANRCVGLALIASLFFVGCGKSNPSNPSQTTPTQPQNIVNTYVGQLDLGGGVTGFVQLRAASSLAANTPDRFPMFARLLSWIEPPVYAQGTPATGLLLSNPGQFATLSGTFSNGIFNMTGGGWTVNASVSTSTSGTSIAGTATSPTGTTASVVTPPAPPVTSPPPSNPAGTYVGTFHIVTTGRQINRRASDNNIEQDCTFTVVIDGQLSLRVFGVLSNGLVQAELTSSWTESGAGTTSPTCGSVAANSWGNIAPPAGVADFEGPPGGIMVARADRTPGPNGLGTLTRAESFFGAMSGTSVVMQVARSFEFVNQLNTIQNGLVNSVMGYPTVSTTTTLVKQ